MQWQLRMYRVKDGEWDAWLAGWRRHVLPLRRAKGFEVRGPWRTEDGQFVWLLGHDGLTRADSDYYASPERAAVEPDPARHVAEARTWTMEDV